MWQMLYHARAIVTIPKTPHFERLQRIVGQLKLSEYEGAAKCFKIYPLTWQLKHN
jgi:hypothetical protein